MSEHPPEKVVGKSPYATGTSSRRSRGPFLVITVVILLIAAGIWIMSFTRAVEHTPIGGQSPAVDPGANHR